MKALSWALLLWLGGCAAFGWGGSKTGGEGVSAAIAPPLGFDAITAARRTVVQPGDGLIVTLKGTSTVVGEATVTPDGHATLPRIGDARVADLSLDQVAAMIGKEGGDVEVALRAPPDIFVVGSVAAPGEFAYKSGMTLGDAVALAGGASYKADLRSVYVKPRGAETESEIGYDPALPILPGDVVRLAERYF